MQTILQPGQKVLTPDGVGLIEQIIGEEVTVKLEEGGASKVYHSDQLADDSSAG